MTEENYSTGRNKGGVKPRCTERCFSDTNVAPTKAMHKDVARVLPCFPLLPPPLSSGTATLPTEVSICDTLCTLHCDDCWYDFATSLGCKGMLSSSTRSISPQSSPNKCSNQPIEPYACPHVTSTTESRAPEDPHHGRSSASNFSPGVSVDE